MQRAIVDGVRLEFEVTGDGEPVVFIHGSLIADAFRPLVAEPALARGYRLITYHRRGYAGSSPPDRLLSIAQQAADCRALLAHLNIERAHVAGHSFGGVVALQLALDAPEVVHTLALLEPALAVGESGPAYRESLASAGERYRELGAHAAVHAMLEARSPGYRALLEDLLPGAFDQAVKDAPYVFEFELPGLLDWSFDEAAAQRIAQPALCVLGAESETLWSRFGETHRALCAWLPRAEPFTLPGATHLLQVQNAHDMAHALAGFYGRHSLRT